MATDDTELDLALEADFHESASPRPQSPEILDESASGDPVVAGEGSGLVQAGTLLGLAAPTGPESVTAEATPDATLNLESASSTGGAPTGTLLGMSPPENPPRADGLVPEGFGPVAPNQPALADGLVPEGSGPVAPSQPAPVAPKGPSMFARFIGWFTRGRALKDARAALAGEPSSVTESRQRAAIARELAKRALEPVDPLESGSGAHLAIELYAHAVYWLLTAIKPTPAPEALSRLERWESADPALIEAAAGGPLLALQLKQRLAQESFVEVSGLSVPYAKEEARKAQGFVEQLFAYVDQKQTLVDRLRFQRFYRLGVVVLLVTGMIGAAIWGVQIWQRGPNLLAGKAWRASSKRPNCPIERGICEGKKVSIFFCTNTESKPWVEYDLGGPESFSRVDITNRLDCCRGAAVPLVVEVSDDQKKWKVVTQQKEAFGWTTLKFPATTARYLRLRVTRRTALSLEKVSVYR